MTKTVSRTSTADATHLNARHAGPRTEQDATILDRVDRSLETLDQLSQALDETEYDVPELDFELPPNFLLSVIIPVYNEEDTVATILSRLRKLPLPMEIIVVDDNSQDGTVDRLKQLAQSMELTVVYKPANAGKGAALRTGFQYARGTVVTIQDADLEYDPRDIPRLIRPIVENRADVVYGSRFLDDQAVGSSWVHTFGNRLLTAFSNLTTGLRLTDMETCYKVFRREFLTGVEICQNRFGFEPEITAKVARRKARFCELPIQYHARNWQEGKKIGFRDGLNALYCIVRYAFSRVPLSDAPATR